MSATNPEARSVEQLGAALDMLGWTPSTGNSRPATRAEMLGMLLFVVETEMRRYEDAKDTDAELQTGYMLALRSRALGVTSGVEEYAKVSLVTLIDLVARRQIRTAASVRAALEAAPESYGAERLIEPLSLAMRQLLLLAPVDSDSESAGPQRSKRALDEVRRRLGEARQLLEDSRRRLKRLDR